MKQLILIAITCIFFLMTNAQDSARMIPMDKSPMDMSYFPDLYPLKKFQGKITTPPIIRVIYGRPQKDGRDVFGTLLKFGEIWRLGANEATEIEFYKDVKIDNKKVAKGRYSLYCIPTATNWTFIINKDTDSWGAFKYDSKKDLLRVTVPVTHLTSVVESLSIYFDKTDKGSDLTVTWDKTESKLPISF
jgi:Protein of unknown function (DUF2911)